MYSTKYKVAKNINEAVSLFSDFNEPKYLAGGMTLIPTLKQRLLKTDLLIDLKNCNCQNDVSTDTSLIKASWRDKIRIPINKQVKDKNGESLSDILKISNFILIFIYFKGNVEVAWQINSLVFSE